MSRLPYLKINNDNIQHDRYNITHCEVYDDKSRHNVLSSVFKPE